MNGLEIDIPPFVMRETNRTPDFLSKFPLGKVPAFEGADGFCLTESVAIATYLAKSGPKADQLLGSGMIFPPCFSRAAHVTNLSISQTPKPKPSSHSGLPFQRPNCLTTYSSQSPWLAVSKTRSSCHGKIFGIGGFPTVRLFFFLVIANQYAKNQ